MIVAPTLEMLLSLMVGIVIGESPVLELENLGLFSVWVRTSYVFTLMLLLCLGFE